VFFEEVLNLYRANVDSLDIIRHSPAVFGGWSPPVLPGHDRGCIVIAGRDDPHDFRLVAASISQEIELVIHRGYVRCKAGAIVRVRTSDHADTNP
jgi:hypothetical protein